MFGAIRSLLTAGGSPHISRYPGRGLAILVTVAIGAALVTPLLARVAASDPPGSTFTAANDSGQASTINVAGFPVVSDTNLEFRAAAGHADRLPAFAAELVRLKVDVMLIDGGAAAVAAKHATSDVPIVVGAMGDPARDGIVASLAQPGGNISGFSVRRGEGLYVTYG